MRNPQAKATIFTFLAILILVLGRATPILGLTTVTVEIIPGNLNLFDSSDPKLQAIVKDGDGRLINSGRQISIADARGNGGGWNLIVAATDFINDTDQNKQIPAANLRVLASPVVKTVAGNDPPIAAAGIVGKDGLKLLSSPPGRGMGSYHISFNFELKIPPAADDGTYTAYLIETLTSGP